MTIARLSCVLLLLLAWGADRARAEEDGVAVAKKLAAATVTVRAISPESEGGKPAEVTVFSGVSLGGGLIVTYSTAPDSWSYRLTLPDGSQADGLMSVKDLYSSLVILEIRQTDLPGLTLAEELPDAGSTLYTAAAAGIEKPVVSRGILGAVDRKFGGRELPPLLQCDVRTTETSPGAAMVDREGRLLGIIAINSLPGHGDGWTYAVPLRHIKRVREAYTKGEVKTLRQQRPVLGLTLAGTAKDGVEVEAVTAGGPGEKAGVRKGDQVLAVQGQKVRSVYHVVGEVIKHQPGDKVEFTIQQGDVVKNVTLTLARGEPQRPAGLVAKLNERGAYEISPYRAEGATPPSRIPRDPVGMVQEEVKRVYGLLEILKKANERLTGEVEKMRSENAALKREVAELKQGERK